MSDTTAPARTRSTPHRPTHEVLNQPPPIGDHNPYDGDLPLQEAVHREGGGWSEEQLRSFGAIAGRERSFELAQQANHDPPVLHTHDRYGHRIDEVEFHPAWHELMQEGIAAGAHSLAWTETRPGSHVARAALLYLLPEHGTACPISMTHSVIPALRKQEELAKEWEPRALSNRYDRRFVPASEKSGILFGMAMTEKQGGSDVRANTTRALAAGETRGPGAEYTLTGHKWFCSAPMCDAFLTLAQSDGGLSCFLVPRWLADGSRNRFLIQRLKNKLGNRSNASSEIELDGTWSRMVGEEGRGVATIIEMVRFTRLDVALGSAGLMRQALTQALHHTRHRQAFGRRLIDQPLMRNVLADLALEAEAATALAMRTAGAFDRSAGDEGEAHLGRIVTGIGKYSLAKRAAGFVCEALECLGGNGYVEESGMPRLFRESPLGSIWEGSGNVQCLDVLRAMRRQPESVDALLQELEAGRGGDRRLDSAIDRVRDALTKSPTEGEARRLVERLARVLEGGLLVRHAPAAVADAFCASRLEGDWGPGYGTLPPTCDLTAILERARLAELR